LGLARVGDEPGEERGALAAGMRTGRLRAGGEWAYVELVHVQTHLVVDVQFGVRRLAEAYVVALALLVLFAFASVKGGGPACGDKTLDEVIFEFEITGLCICDFARAHDAHGTHGEDHLVSELTGGRWAQTERVADHLSGDGKLVLLLFSEQTAHAVEKLGVRHVSGEGGGEASVSVSAEDGVEHGLEHGF
jgi:hypothetical protein